MIEIGNGSRSVPASGSGPQASDAGDGVRCSVIAGTGACIPARTVRNEDFVQHRFFEGPGLPLDAALNPAIVAKLEEITEIAERRYAEADQVASDLAVIAAADALQSSGIDGESLDYLIVAHNFGDVRHDNPRSDFVPSLAARVKQRLAIANPYCVAYDLPFGCPGWLQGVIQADYFLRSGDARRALIIGAETLSRVSDPHDRDSMIYADGAGAVILEARTRPEPVGILGHATRSDTLEHAMLLRMDRSFDPGSADERLYLKMEGHRLYEYALKTVPDLVLESLRRAGVSVGDVDKILLHQANGKMDKAIVKRLFRMSGLGTVPPDVLPMNISWMGNSSVATVPTLLDALLKGKLDGHVLRPGDLAVLASVGAGMNVNSLVYRFDPDTDVAGRPLSFDPA